MSQFATQLGAKESGAWVFPTPRIFLEVYVMIIWFPQVITLFEHTLRAVLAQPVFALLLGVLVLLIVVGMFGWLCYLGRKGRI